MLGKAVNDARYQRRFRPYDGQRTACALANCANPSISMGSAARSQASAPVRPRVAGCDKHPGNSVGLCELPGQGVLAATAPDHQNIHLVSLYLSNQCRK